MRIFALCRTPCFIILAASCGGNGSGSSESTGSTSSVSGSSPSVTGAQSGSVAASGGSGTVSMVPTSGTAISPTSGSSTGATTGAMNGSGSPSSGASGASGTNSGSGTSSLSGATAASGAASAGAPDAGYSYDAALPATVDSGAAIPIGDMTNPRKLYIENRCTYTIWSFALPPSTFPGGVPLKSDPGQQFVTTWPDKWQGRIWGRTKCTGTGGNLSCAQGNGPDTLAEFALTAGMASDWYDISLVDGFAVPTGILQLTQSYTISPNYVPSTFNASGMFVEGSKLGPDGLCGSPVCAVDLLANCPASQVKKGPDGTIAACHNGDNGPGAIAAYFKVGCPTSYSWPFDDPWSLFRCADYRANNGVGAKDYKIVYCPVQGATPGFPPYPINQ